MVNMSKISTRACSRRPAVAPIVRIGRIGTLPVIHIMLCGRRDQGPATRALKYYALSLKSSCFSAKGHMPPTTMKRIAGELGVSITTVSKVLNNRGDIGEATRTRVLAKVEELGYQRNAVARSLSLRRTHTLGIVIPDLMHSFFVEIIAGIKPVASVRGYGLLLCSSSEDPGQGRPERERVRGRQVDGVVLASAHGTGNTDILQQLVKRGTSLVMIDRDDHAPVKCHR